MRALVGGRGWGSGPGGMREDTKGNRKKAEPGGWSEGF